MQAGRLTGLVGLGGRACRARIVPNARIARWYSDKKPVDESKAHLTPSKASPESTPVKKVEYIPKASYPRVSYEYPAPPQDPGFKPVESSKIKKHLPLLAGIGGLLWAVYAYRHFMTKDEGEKQSALEQDKFMTFKLTCREDISSDIALLELSPKYATQKEFLKKNKGLWNGKKIWSVEVKQPEIQVVRKYTPLPLYFMQYKEGGDSKKLLRILGKAEDEGRMVLMVKRYEDGEVSRYLHKLPVGSDIEIRGPFVDYKFPYSPTDKLEPREAMEDVPTRMKPEGPHPASLPPPEDVAFFAGGTGITAILQSLLSVNPPRGMTHVYYSVRSADEIPIKRFLLFLEKAGRAKFHYFIDSDSQFLTAKDVPKPSPKHFSRNIDADTDLEREAKILKLMGEIRKEIKEDPEAGEASVSANSSVAAPPTTKVATSPASNVSAEPSKQQQAADASAYHSLLHQVASRKNQTDARPTLAVVCGPEGYVSYVSGPRGPQDDGPIRGVLGQVGWDETNTTRMKP